MGDEIEVSASASTETSSTAQSTETGAGNAATQTGNTAQTFDWKGAPPSELSQAFGGAKTWEDIKGRWSSSSSEAQKWRQQAEEQQRKLETIETVQKHMALNQPKPSQVDQYPFLGFKDKDAYLAALEHDPVGTKLKENAWMQEKNMEAVEKRVNDIIEKRLQPFHESASQQRRTAHYQETIKHFPEVAEGGSLRPVIEQWVARNKPAYDTLVKLSETTDLNTFEIVVNAALGPMWKEQLNASKAGTATRQQAAGNVAKPGAGTRGATEPGDAKEAIKQIGEKTGVSKSFAEGLAESLDESFAGIKGKKAITSKR